MAVISLFALEKGHETHPPIGLGGGILDPGVTLVRREGRAIKQREAKIAGEIN